MSTTPKCDKQIQDQDQDQDESVPDSDTDDELDFKLRSIECQKCSVYTHVSHKKCIKCGEPFKMSKSGYSMTGTDGDFICDDDECDDGEELEEEDSEDTYNEDDETSSTYDEDEDEDEGYDSDDKDYKPKVDDTAAEPIPKRARLSREGKRYKTYVYDTDEGLCDSS